MGLPILDGSCKCNEPIDVCGVFDYSVTLVVLHNGKMLMYCVYAVHQLNECDETKYLFHWLKSSTFAHCECAYAHIFSVLLCFYLLGTHTA